MILVLLRADSSLPVVVVVCWVCFPYFLWYFLFVSAAQKLYYAPRVLSILATSAFDNKLVLFLNVYYTFLCRLVYR